MSPSAYSMRRSTEWFVSTIHRVDVVGANAMGIEPAQRLDSLADLPALR